MIKSKMVLALFLFSVTSALSSDADTFLKKTDTFFKKYVNNGSVAYKSIVKNLPEIEGLYTEVGSADLSGIDDNTKKSFYINAYNIAVIYWVVKHYPLKSPLDDSGFFDKVKHKIAGEDMTLNSLEIKKLLLAYKDARIHHR